MNAPPRTSVDQDAKRNRSKSDTFNGSFRGTTGGAPTWRVGDPVVISGLRQRQEMNGCEGIVWKPVSTDEPDYLLVRLNASGQVVKVRHENASIIPSGVRSAPAGGAERIAAANVEHMSRSSLDLVESDRGSRRPKDGRVESEQRRRNQGAVNGPSSPSRRDSDDSSSILDSMGGPIYGVKTLREILEAHMPRTLQNAALCIKRLKSELSIIELAAEEAASKGGGRGLAAVDNVQKQVKLVDEIMSSVYTAADACADRNERRPVIETADALAAQISRLQKKLAAAGALGADGHPASSRRGPRGPEEDASPERQRIRELEEELAAMRAEVERERADRRAAEVRVRDLERRLRH